MSKLYTLKRSDTRRGAWLVTLMLLATWLAYALWHPGREITDGRHDRGHNAMWLSHGWLGADAWFTRYRKHKELGKYRDPERIQAFAAHLNGLGIRDVFPHVAPADSNGELPPVDPDQTERFLTVFADFRVLPWIGGVLGKQVQLDDIHWRQTFVRSSVRLLTDYPRFAGIHLNIEPCVTGNLDFLALLQELREALPDGKLLSVAAFPPPTPLHPFPNVHWDETYFRHVSRIADQMAVMMYDTALPASKLYRALIEVWTRQVLGWSEHAELLLGVPTYDDADAGYHDPRVENLQNALAGIHAGLAVFPKLPARYQGVAIYAGWETDRDEWGYWRHAFQALPDNVVGDRPP